MKIILRAGKDWRTTATIESRGGVITLIYLKKKKDQNVLGLGG